jgi:UDP-N-acetyl-D-glucosamine/UDP-N-acetyl-D-galactosamine dehydrogenase
MPEKIAIIGLGYVGLPLALAVAKNFPGTVGFDINQKKLAQLRDGIEATGEVFSDVLRGSTLKYSSQVDDLKGCTFFIVSVPTPVDLQKRPDLTPLIKASETVGKALSKGAVVVYESTVYPGVTEDVCGPVLEKVSGLKRGVDFTLGYSPERINPGETRNTHSNASSKWSRAKTQRHSNASWHSTAKWFQLDCTKLHRSKLQKLPK